MNSATGLFHFISRWSVPDKMSNAVNDLVISQTVHCFSSKTAHPGHQHVWLFFNLTIIIFSADKQ
jgi:hypothetical protein